MDEIIEHLYISERSIIEELPEDEYKVLLISLHSIGREHVQVAIDDGVSWPSETVGFVIDTISNWLAEGERVCVACDAGISRSAGAITAYLVFKAGMDLEGALDLVKSKRSMVNPHPFIVESIIKHLRQKQKEDDGECKGV
jgi:protein-tyrosine phosphatase